MNHPHWLESKLKDPLITDICLNGTEAGFFDRGAGMEPFSTPWTEEEMRNWVLTQISTAGKSWDARHPFVDGALPSRHRFHFAFPPLARQGIFVSLRKLPEAQTSASSSRWSKSPLFSVLQTFVRQNDNLLIAGATGSGKTTLASDLLSEVPHHERMIALEDTPELSPPHPHFITLLSRPPNSDGHGEVTLRTLLKQTLRMRPDRIILGECRGSEVLDLLQVLNTGHRGTIATIHANSARDALRRIELLCLLAAGGSISPSIIRELVASGIQAIAFVGKKAHQREILDLWRIDGREGDTILLRPVAPLSLAG